MDYYWDYKNLWSHTHFILQLLYLCFCYNTSVTTVSFLYVFSGGIKEGDVIVKLNGQPVQTTADIHKVLRRDQPLLLEIRRGNDDLLFNINPQVIAHWRTGQFIWSANKWGIKLLWSSHIRQYKLIWSVWSSQSDDVYFVWWILISWTLGMCFIIQSVLIKIIV